MQRRDGVDEVEVVWVVRVTIVGRPSTAWGILGQRPSGLHVRDPRLTDCKVRKLQAHHDDTCQRGYNQLRMVGGESP